jgi:hypothetical protein
MSVPVMDDRPTRSECPIVRFKCDQYEPQYGTLVQARTETMHDRCRKRLRSLESHRRYIILNRYTFAQGIPIETNRRPSERVSKPPV